MKTLHVTVSNKVAEYRERDGFIVCGNSNYQIEFAFDSEWDEHEEKTARFVWNERYFDQEFTGNVCPCPIVYNTTEVSVGVYAGNLETTTGASIPCRPSILCKETTPHPESGQNYSNEAKQSAAEARASAEAAAESERVAKESEIVATECAEVAVAAEARAVEAVSGATSRLSAVETQASINSKRLTNLEKGLTPDPFVTDDTVAYQKTVPENALPFAAIERVGGMSYKCNNLANMLDFRNNYGVINADGSLTISVSWDLDCHAIYTGKLKSGTYTITNLSEKTMYVMFSSGDYSRSVIAGAQRTFTYDGSSYLKFQFEVQVANASTTYKIMLNEGSTALPYEPYFEGIRHAAGTAIESEGANVLNIPDADVSGTHAYYSRNLGDFNISSGTYTLSFNYTSSGKAAGAVSIRKGESGVLKEGYFDGEGAGLLSVTFTVPDDINSIRIYLYSNRTSQAVEARVVATNFMVNRGTTALPYAPYVKRTSPIPEELRALDGYGWGINEDFNNCTDFEKHKYVKSVDVARIGDLPCSLANGGTYKVIQCKFTPNVYGAPFGVGICSGFQIVQDYVSEIPVGQAMISKNDNCIYYKVSDMTVDEFLAEHGDDIVVYALATPEVTDITHLISPDNFIEVEAGGTITFVNEHELAAPSTILYMTKEETV